MRRKGHRSKTRSLRLRNRNQVPTVSNPARQITHVSQIRFFAPEQKVLAIQGARRCVHCFFQGVHVEPGSTCGHV